ncbi:hypothetical protein BH10BAC5_BH10BAC5_27710 [soil metagenome]
MKKIEDIKWEFQISRFGTGPNYYYNWEAFSSQTNVKIECTDGTE